MITADHTRTRVGQKGTLRLTARALVPGLLVCGATLITAPVLLTLYLSLFDEKLILFPPRGYTLGWYSAIVPNFGGAAITSLKLAAAATGASLLLGVPAGIGLARYRFRGRGAIATLLLAPLTVPGIALGLASYVALVALDERLDATIAGSMAGLILAHVMITTPWVVRLCLASLSNRDHAAEEAAASLGAGPLIVIWRVTLPAMRAGITAAALFAFVISFENLELALFLSSPGVTTLPVAVLQYLAYHIDRWFPRLPWSRSSLWRRSCSSSTGSFASVSWPDDGCSAYPRSSQQAIRWPDRSRCG
jgi:putative spermidine/putrescine transport system permease protein